MKVVLIALLLLALTGCDDHPTTTTSLPSDQWRVDEIANLGQGDEVYTITRGDGCQVVCTRTETPRSAAMVCWAVPSATCSPDFSDAETYGGK